MGEERLVLSWLAGFGIRFLEGGQVPIRLIQRALQGEAGMHNIRMEYGMTANHDESVDPCIRPRWNHVIRMREGKRLRFLFHVAMRRSLGWRHT
jgi:hypothetical protein